MRSTAMSLLVIPGRFKLPTYRLGVLRQEKQTIKIVKLTILLKKFVVYFYKMC